MIARLDARWRSIVALNAVSLLSQLGQFGIGFAVIPLWLSHRGLGVVRLGDFAALQWTGMLAGIVVAPALARRGGPRVAVGIGLLATLAAFGTIAALDWPALVLPALLSGFGVGVRWIANETWLFRLVPEEASGRIVGAHETLIALAGMLGPAIAIRGATAHAAALWIGAAVTAAAGLPLLAASARLDRLATPTHGNAGDPAEMSSHACASIGLGWVVAAAAGIGDGAIFGLAVKFGEGNGIDATSCAMLLTVFGLGSTVGQYPVGWAVDRIGVPTVTAGCALAGAAAGLALALAAGSIGVAVPAMFVLGLANHALLTLACITVAAAPRAHLDRLMRAISIVFTLGSIAGPFVASHAMLRFGANALMWLIAFVCATSCAYAFGLRHGFAARARSSRRRTPRDRSGRRATVTR
ncbi:MFS transporter [Burkholderia guangdongensis]|uniref:MFS transporter n=1 Tax=Burkholderia guangdongensis TaxID=1792500 RepID=UPI0015CA1E45|nr:MFS transporter [Burkholderia guangdongensis]